MHYWNITRTGRVCCQSRRVVHFIVRRNGCGTTGPTSPIANVLKLSHQVAGWFRDRFSSGEAPDPEFQDNPSLPTPGKQEALAGIPSESVKSGSKA
ncbi:hypothetical protein [Gimesia benthica]|uniref:hypothetical protein n=1 Tax=Gimesia benthica TaxID=2608982 RepID=UPI0012D2C6B5|nr:hypothetical protein [Gimesia benthica]